MAYEIAKTVISGRKVSAAGAAAKLITAVTGCFRVDVSADVNNAKSIVVGGPEVVALAGSQKGTILFPGNNALTILVTDVSKIWVDAEQAGDAACFTYYIA